MNIDHTVRHSRTKRYIGIALQSGDIGERYVVNHIDVTSKQRCGTRGLRLDEPEHHFVPRLSEWTLVTVIFLDYQPVALFPLDELVRASPDRGYSLVEVLGLEAKILFTPGPFCLTRHDEDRCHLVRHQRVRPRSHNVDGVIVDLLDRLALGVGAE